MMFALPKLAASCNPLRYEVARTLVFAQLAIDRHNAAHVDASECIQLLFEHTVSIVGAELAPMITGDIMDPLRNAIDQRAFTPDEQAKINERIGKISTTLDDEPVPPTQRTGHDCLTTLARMALRDDNEDLHELATVLVKWSDREKACRVAKCALELSELRSNLT